VANIPGTFSVSRWPTKKLPVVEQELVELGLHPFADPEPIGDPRQDPLQGP
jgi:hypothetical protein